MRRPDRRQTVLKRRSFHRCSFNFWIRHGSTCTPDPARSAWRLSAAVRQAPFLLRKILVPCLRLMPIAARQTSWLRRLSCRCRLAKPFGSYKIKACIFTIFILIRLACARCPKLQSALAALLTTDGISFWSAESCRCRECRYFKPERIRSCRYGWRCYPFIEKMRHLFGCNSEQKKRFIFRERPVAIAS